MTATPNVQQILSHAQRACSAGDETRINRAYAYAQSAHEGHVRESGVPYFTHAVATAINLARIGADTETIIGGLLHDTVEDTDVTLHNIRTEFGDEVAFLVDGVTKLGKLKYRGLKRHVETLRKLFLATAQDPRVILIKLADRLHNLETIEPLPRAKQERIAHETLEIYAPIAHRLGIGNIKGELEDRAFMVAFPDEYARTLKLREEKSKETIEQLHTISHELKKRLAQANIKTVAMDYRIKHLYSLYKKLKQKDMNIEQVYDIAALRIIVDTIEECYVALGIVHSAWKPLPGRIKDYIAMPKKNGYQSLHTTIFTGDGALVEVQIRTEAMHHIAEYGIASHVSYKEREKVRGTSSATLATQVFGKNTRPATPTASWLEDMTKTQAGTERSVSFIRDLKSDFFNDRILVFTPTGEVIDLPTGATPLDFAYAVHSDLGNHASGARVNGKFVALSTKLSQGDVVHIEKHRTAKPSHKWLEWVKTSAARKRIKIALEKH